MVSQQLQYAYLTFTAYLEPILNHVKCFMEILPPHRPLCSPFFALYLSSVQHPHTLKTQTILQYLLLILKHILKNWSGEEAYYHVHCSFFLRFPYVWKTFSHCFRERLLIANYFSFSSFENVCISSSFLKDIFSVYKILN